MQLLKNKQSHSYHHGYLEVLEKYAYLKDNATKKKAEASHNTGAEEGGNLNNNADSDLIGQKSKRVVPVPVAAQCYDSCEPEDAQHVHKRVLCEQGSMVRQSRGFDEASTAK